MLVDGEIILIISFIKKLLNTVYINWHSKKVEGTGTMRDQNHIKPNPRVPTWVDIWARGLDVDVSIFDDDCVQSLIEDGRATTAIERCLKISEEKSDQTSIAVLSNLQYRLELGLIIVDYFSKKPSRSTRRNGESDLDQETRR